MTHLRRCLRIFERLMQGVNEVTFQRVEAELGLTPRPESHDAGRPWTGDQWTPEQLAEIRARPAQRIEPNKITPIERIEA